MRQGYVGLPLARRAVDVGRHVVGLEANEDRVKRFLTGESYIAAGSRMLAPYLRAGATVILESTTYPGTTEELVLEFRSGLVAGDDFNPGYSPERKDPGNPGSTCVAERLVAFGADVRAADPYVVEQHVSRHVERVEVTPKEVASADAVVLLTDHDVFDLTMIRNEARYVLDTRHRLQLADGVEYL